jgi:hypothetical protein
MRTRQLLLSLVTLLMIVPLLSRASGIRQATPPAMSALQSIPIVADYRYRISGAARPLMLFWIGRDNVGGARITRRLAPDGTLGLEMLTGSDPARAPFHTNRWGYIREIVRGGVAEIVAVKSDIEEETIEEAKASAKDKNSARSLEFIRERVTPTEAVAWSRVADVERDVSYRDLEFVLGRMATLDDWQEQRLERPPDARSGFLVAFMELMDNTVAASTNTNSPKSAPAPNALVYIHRAKLYDLQQDQIELLNDFDAGTRGRVRALHGRFRIHNRETNETSGEFFATYGMDGELAGVPLHMQYQPRWWLRTALILDESTTFATK